MPKPDAVNAGLSKRYVLGFCGVHIHQFQKNEGPGADTSQYRLTVILKDGVGAIIGGADQVQASDFTPVDVDSHLPAVFVATASGVDSDPITFNYNGATWDSNSDHCSFGGYGSGSRQGDCGFSC